MEILQKPKKFTYQVISNIICEKSQNKDIENYIWITATNKHIPVKSMTTSHILNCIACWEHRGNMRIPFDYLGGKKKWLKIFKQELINRS